MKKNKFIVKSALALSLFTLAGCGNSAAPAAQVNQAEDTVTFTDSLDREITVNEPLRTAVLSGSLADAWQLAGGQLSAVTEDAKDTITVTGDMVILGGVKSPNMELMIGENIDFAILSSSIAEHVKLLNTLGQAGIQAAYFDVESFEDYAAMMKVMTDITGNKELYKQNAEDVRMEIEEQIARIDGSAPTVLFLRAYSTGIKVKGSDSMTGRILKDLGCVNLADSEKSLLENLSMEAVIEADPDFIFVTTMGESKDAALSMIEEILTNNPAWNGLTAVKNNRFHILPKELFHNKPNERWGESYRILADYLYGEK